MAWYLGFLVPSCTATKLAPEYSPWTLNKTWLGHLVWWLFPVLNMTRVHFWNIASFQSLQTCLSLWGDRLSPSSALTRYRWLKRASLGVITGLLLLLLSGRGKAEGAVLVQGMEQVHCVYYEPIMLRIFKINPLAGTSLSCARTLIFQELRHNVKRPWGRFLVWTHPLQRDLDSCYSSWCATFDLDIDSLSGGNSWKTQDLGTSEWLTWPLSRYNNKNMDTKLSIRG